jgi:hypothetical protein
VAEEEKVLKFYLEPGFPAGEKNHAIEGEGH